jgi:hypothetical protein
MTVEIHEESGHGWTSYRWSATHEGGMILSRSFGSEQEARSDSDLAPSIVEILDERNADTALARLADLADYLLARGELSKARSLLQAVKLESGWVP